MEVLQLRAELFKKLSWHHWEKAGAGQDQDKFPVSIPTVLIGCCKARAYRILQWFSSLQVAQC